MYRYRIESMTLIHNKRGRKNDMGLRFKNPTMAERREVILKPEAEVAQRENQQ